MPTYRRLTTNDANLLPAANTLYQATVNAGQWTAWGGIANYTRAYLTQIVQDNNQRLYGVFDDVGALRGILHVAKVINIILADGSSSPVWELLVGIYDPTLPNLTLAQVAKAVVVTAAKAFPGIYFQGVTISGSQEDTFWNNLFPSYRTVMVDTERSRTLAFYRVPTDVIGAA